jgi:hypothetical protein
LWLADLGLGDTGLDLESIVADIDKLGPEGQQNAHIWLGLYTMERQDAGLGCRADTCLNALDDGEGWDGYCGTHADLIAQHDAGEHTEAPRLDDCPKCIDAARPPERTLERTLEQITDDTITHDAQVDGATLVDMRRGMGHGGEMNMWRVTYDVNGTRYTFIQGHLFLPDVLGTIYTDKHGYGHSNEVITELGDELFKRIEASRIKLCTFADKLGDQSVARALLRLGYTSSASVTMTDTAGNSADNAADDWRHCATCGGAIEDDPDGSEGVLVHSRDLEPPDGYEGMDAYDLDEDHIALDEDEYNAL